MPHADHRDEDGLALPRPGFCREALCSAHPARLDADGTARPLTEIVAVMPESLIDARHMTVHVGQAAHYVVRPTREEPTETSGYRTLYVAFERVTGTAEYVADDEAELRRSILDAGDDTSHYNIVGPYAKVDTAAPDAVAAAPERVKTHTCGEGYLCEHGYCSNAYPVASDVAEDSGTRARAALKGGPDAR